MKGFFDRAGSCVERLGVSTSTSLSMRIFHKRGFQEVYSTSQIAREEAEERRLEREEARIRKEEKERQADERRYAHEHSQSLIQLAIAKVYAGISFLLRSSFFM